MPKGMGYGSSGGYSGRDPKRGGVKAPGSETCKKPKGTTPKVTTRHNKQKPGI